MLAHIATLFAVIFWATSFLSTKVLMDSGGFTPVEMYVYRFTLAYFILLALTFRNIRSHSTKDELVFFLSGICAGSLFFITENYALVYTTTGNVSLLSSIAPLLTTFLMAIVYRQRISIGVIVGSVIAIVGIVMIIFSHGESVEVKPAGDLLALATALCWAIYTIAIRRLIPLYTSLFITRKIFFYGVITALPLLLLQRQPMHLHLLFNFSQPEFILNLMYLVLCCSIAAYLIINESMKILGAVKANNYLYLQPMITMIAGYLILHEPIFILGYIGCILVIGGLIISDKWKGAISTGKRR